MIELERGPALAAKIKAYYPPLVSVLRAFRHKPKGKPFGLEVNFKDSPARYSRASDPGFMRCQGWNLEDLKPAQGLGLIFHRGNDYYLTLEGERVAEALESAT